MSNFTDFCMNIEKKLATTIKASNFIFKDGEVWPCIGLSKSKAGDNYIVQYSAYSKDFASLIYDNLPKHVIGAGIFDYMCGSIIEPQRQIILEVGDIRNSELLEKIIDEAKLIYSLTPTYRDCYIFLTGNPLNKHVMPCTPDEINLRLGILAFLQGLPYHEHFETARRARNVHFKNWVDRVQRRIEERSNSSV